MFSLTSEIAQTVAVEIEASITPAEKQLIEKKPTTNITAYDIFLQAREQHNIYWNNNKNRDALEKAISYYQLVLGYDSTYARAYTGLAFAFRDKHFWDTYFEEDFLDSALNLANTALSYDNQLDEAYRVRGRYYRDHGMYDEAIREFEKVLEYNPNSWQSYYHLGGLHFFSNKAKVVENYIKAIELNRGSSLPSSLRELGAQFAWLKMEDLAEEYYREAFEIDNDLEKYNGRLQIFEANEYDRGIVVIEEMLEKQLKELEKDSTLNYDRGLGQFYSVLGDHDEAYKYYSRVIDEIEKTGRPFLSIAHRIGYALWMVGQKEKAMEYFDTHLYHCLESIKLTRPYSIRMAAYYDLAGYYAFFGDKAKAYEYLDQWYNGLSYFGGFYFMWILFDPMFNEIREEERFRDFLAAMEEKDQQERERVRKWLEENDIWNYDNK
jgi:tetratricopeptide (TPR) repeat protein